MKKLYIIVLSISLNNGYSYGFPRIKPNMLPKNTTNRALQKFLKEKTILKQEIKEMSKEIDKVKIGIWGSFFTLGSCLMARK